MAQPQSSTPEMRFPSTRTLKCSRSLWMRWRASGRSAESACKRPYAWSKGSLPTGDAASPGPASRRCDPQGCHRRRPAAPPANWHRTRVAAPSRPPKPVVDDRSASRIASQSGEQGRKQRASVPSSIPSMYAAGHSLRDRIVAAEGLAKIDYLRNGQYERTEARGKSVVLEVVPVRQNGPRSRALCRSKENACDHSPAPMGATALIPAP